eukprot:1189113-Prorocentrum_minimum.AAC.1
MPTGSLLTGKDRGSSPNDMGDNLPLVSLGTGRTATHIDLGDAHTCVVLDNALVKCWGDNGSGRCGLGGKWNQSQGTRENIPGVGTNRRGLERIFQGLEPVAGE